jgi:hypothetical protein
MKKQIRNPKYQTSTNGQNLKFQTAVAGRLGYLVIGFWDLFGICVL